MSNEQYLIASYFALGAVCTGFGVGTYLLLRRHASNLVESFHGSVAARLIRRFFAVGVILPSMLGFLTVSYYSCDVNTYEKVIENRAYLVGKNMDQLWWSATLLMYALVVWLAIVTALIIFGRAKTGKSQGT